jgi:hypothetical protein
MALPAVVRGYRIGTACFAAQPGLNSARYLDGRFRPVAANLFAEGIGNVAQPGGKAFRRGGRTSKRCVADALARRGGPDLPHT